MSGKEAFTEAITVVGAVVGDLNGWANFDWNYVKKPLRPIHMKRGINTGDYSHRQFEKIDKFVLKLGQINSAANVYGKEAFT